MKYQEIKSLTIEELREKVVTEQASLRKLKFAHAISPIENPMKIRNSRRLIAKLKTAQNAHKTKNK